MSDFENRLIRCISSIFPNLNDQDIRELDARKLVDSDSLAAVTLMALIDEEFGVILEFDSLVKLGSFDAIRQYLSERASNVGCEEQRTP